MAHGCHWHGVQSVDTTLSRSRDISKKMLAERPLTAALAAWADAAKSRGLHSALALQDRIRRCQGGIEVGHLCTVGRPDELSKAWNSRNVVPSRATVWLAGALESAACLRQKVRGEPFAALFFKLHSMKGWNFQRNGSRRTQDAAALMPVPHGGRPQRTRRAARTAAM